MWLPEVEPFFRELGLPFEPKQRVALAVHADAVHVSTHTSSRALSHARFLAFAVALLAASGMAVAGSLDNPKEVDIAHVDERTGQLTLYVVPDGERIVNRGSVDRLRRKLNTYARYARSGQAFADEPRANRSLLPMLAVIVATPVSSVERGNLDGIKLQYRYTDVRFNVEEIDPVPGKNIRIGMRHRIP